MRKAKLQNMHQVARRAGEGRQQLTCMASRQCSAEMPTGAGRPPVTFGLLPWLLAPWKAPNCSAPCRPQTLDVCRE